MKAYVILRTCERTEFETVLFDPDKVIEYLNKNQCAGFTFEVKTYEVPKEKDNFISAPTWPISVPTNGGYRQNICKTWEDCTNPCKDCINCPLMFSTGGTISSPTTEEFEHFGQSVLNDTVKVTCTNDTINKQ